MVENSQALGSAVDARKQWEVISGIERSLERLGALMGGLENRMVNVEARQHDYQKPHWQAMSLMLAGVVTLGGVIGYGINEKIEGVSANVVALAHASIAHKGDGHPDSVVERIGGVQKQLDAVDQRLQSVVPRSEHKVRDDFVAERFTLDSERFKIFQKTITDRAARVETDVNLRIDRLEQALETGLYNGGGVR